MITNTEPETFFNTTNPRKKGFNAPGSPPTQKELYNMIDIEKITDEVYKAYGTDSGIVFGIEPKHRKAIEAILRTAFELYNESPEHFTE